MAMHRNFKGAALMSLAMAGFSVNDAMVRIVSPHMNPGQIMCLRGAMTFAMIFLVAWRMGALGSLKSLSDPYLLTRTLAEVLATVTYVCALALMPLSNTSSIMQALPLVVTMGAAIFLGETVGWRRWLAISAGFGGVLVIIRPGAEGFSAVSLLVVGSVFCAAVRDLATKKIPAGTSSLFISGVTSLAVTLVGAALMPGFGGWRAPALSDVWALAFGSLMLFTAYQTLIMAMRTGEISFIAPFRYTNLLWSITLAVLVLGETVDAYTLIGGAIVIAAGLYMFYRENKLHRRVATAAVEPV